MFNVGNEVKVTWGEFNGIEGTITAIRGKNIVVMLALGFEYELSSDHIEKIESYSIEVLSSNGKIVQVGSYIETRGSLWKVVRVEGNKAICLKMNPCNGQQRKGARETAWTISNIYCR